MEFSGLDLAAGRFTEMSTYIVSQSTIPESALRLAMARLVAAWPVLTWRVIALRYKAYQSPASASILDEMLHVRSLHSEIVEQYLANTTLPSGITVHSYQPLEHLFESHRVPWTDYFCPRIAAVQAAVFRDGTIMKFTAQHVACDIVGLYNVAHAFCESLRGGVQERGAGDPVRYALRAQSDPKHEAPTVPSEATTAKTMPARSQMPSIGYLPLALKFVSNWLPWCRFPTTWQAIHVPELVLEEWRGAARKASASVSTFDLVAAWVHTSLGELAAQRGLPGQERTLISLSLRPWLVNPARDTASELWNPTAAVQIRPWIEQSPAYNDYHRRHVDAARNLRTQLQAARTRTFAARVLGFVQSIGLSPITPQVSELMVLLSSFTHTPFDKLSPSVEAEGTSDVVLVQHQLNYVRAIPTPWPTSPVTAICRKDSAGGYWLEGNLSQALWDCLLDSRVLVPELTCRQKHTLTLAC